MFLLSPLFEPIMGMESSTIYTMVPISQRKRGVVLDASLTNPDMARNYKEYEIERLEAPVLILHTKDDKLALFDSVLAALDRFPDYKLVAFDKGGHLFKGNEEKVKKEIIAFISKNK